VCEARSLLSIKGPRYAVAGKGITVGKDERDTSCRVGRQFRDKVQREREYRFSQPRDQPPSYSIHSLGSSPLLGCRIRVPRRICLAGDAAVDAAMVIVEAGWGLTPCLASLTFFLIKSCAILHRT
jgi:hypothetical protein